MNEIVLPLIGLKIKTQRRVKPLMTWPEAERVIQLAHVEYQPVYKFMLHAAMDQERFPVANADMPS